MIKYLGQQLSAYARSTSLGQQYTALENLGSAVFKKVGPPINWAQQKIQTYNETKQTIQTHTACLEKTKIELPTALEKDAQSIKKASIVLANDILIKTFPNQGFNPLYTKFYNKHMEDFADALIQSLDPSEGIESPLETHRNEYKIRKELLKDYSKDIEDRITTSIKKGILFKEPILERLSNGQGEAIGYLHSIKMTNVPMPPNLNLTLSYKEGHLETTLKDSYDNLRELGLTKQNNTKSYPLPHIAPIADELQEKNTKHSNIEDTFYTRVIKGFYSAKS